MRAEGLGRGAGAVGAVERGRFRADFERRNEALLHRPSTGAILAQNRDAKRTGDTGRALIGRSSALAERAQIGCVTRALDRLGAAGLLVGHAGAVGAHCGALRGAHGSGGAQGELGGAHAVPALEFVFFAGASGALVEGRGARAVLAGDHLRGAGGHRGARMEGHGALAAGADDGELLHAEVGVVDLAGEVFEGGGGHLELEFVDERLRGFHV